VGVRDDPQLPSGKGVLLVWHQLIF